MINAETSHPHYMPTLDGVRGFACLIVVLHHFRIAFDIPASNAIMELGSAGVLIFFALSGFLMTRLYYGTKLDYDSGAKYLVSRFARITPAYFIAIIFVWLIYLNYPEFGVQMDPLMLVRSFTFIGSAGVFWSIPPEVQFYLFFIFMWFCYQRYKDGDYWWAAGLAVLSVAFIATKDYWPGILLPSKYHVFLCGFLVGAIAGYPVIRKYLCNALIQAFLIVGTFAYFTAFIDNQTVYKDLFFPALVALLVMSLSVTTPVSWILKTMPMRVLGNASFSIYLFHDPLIRLYSLLYKGIDLPLTAHYGIVLLLSVGLPIVFYYLCERRLNKMAKSAGLSLAAKVKESSIRRFPPATP